MCRLGAVRIEVRGGTERESEMWRFGQVGWLEGMVEADIENHGGKSLYKDPEGLSKI